LYIEFFELVIEVIFHYCTSDVLHKFGYTLKSEMNEEYERETHIKHEKQCYGKHVILRLYQVKQDKNNGRVEFVV